MKKKCRMTLWIAAILCMLSGIHAWAANPKSVSLSPAKTYTAYDITGDGKADSIRIVRSGKHYGYYSGLKVTVNGSTAYSLSAGNYSYYAVKASLYTLANGKVFLYLYAYGDNYDGPVCAVFHYAGGKLVKKLDFQKYVKKIGIHTYGYVDSVSGNTIKLSFYSMSWTLGAMRFTLSFNYKDHKLVQTSAKGKVTPLLLAHRGKSKFTVHRSSIVTYKKPGSKVKAMTLKKGDKVKITTCYVKKGVIYFKVKKGFQSGWIKQLKKAVSYSTSGGRVKYNYLFNEVEYAG